MKVQMSFGENLINLRKQKGWSQDDLADNLDLSRQAISKWENDTSKPDIDNIKKISQLFSVSIDDLLNNDVVKDKAVTLDVRKKEKKERTITIVKCMIIAIVILYIINVIYKFASLLIIVNGVQKYANLSNYHYVITTYDENGLVEKEECWFKDGVSKTVSDSGSGETIICIDYNEDKGYSNKLGENRVDINMVEYNMAHQNYRNGEQLFRRLPKLVNQRKINTIFLNSINVNLNIKLCEDAIIVQTKNKYMILKRNNLLPILMYSSDDKTIKFYSIEINTVNEVNI